MTKPELQNNEVLTCVFCDSVFTIYDISSLFVENEVCSQECLDNLREEEEKFWREEDELEREEEEREEEEREAEEDEKEYLKNPTSSENAG